MENEMESGSIGSEGFRSTDLDTDTKRITWFPQNRDDKIPRKHVWRAISGTAFAKLRRGICQGANRLLYASGQEFALIAWCTGAQGMLITTATVPVTVINPFSVSCLRVRFENPAIVILLYPYAILRKP